MSPRPAILSYLGAGQAALVGGGFLIAGKAPQAVVFAVGCLFLIYWGRRLDRERGER
ncbi:MAG: hypothetical protein QOF37_1952 [Thermoleophilaceae bacterium]|jgi:hypothetical protein|nr:hypothetical protein [Thermoleophilaceae bacterium]